MEVKVEKIVYPGKSLARGADGIAVFTEGGIPGEILEIKITKNKKSYKEGIIEKINEASKERIQPKCPSFGKCGGCAFQHISYHNQLKMKEGYVNELLYKYRDVIKPIVRSTEEWGYRNKMEFSFFEENGVLELGLHRKGFFDAYLAVPPCFIADRDFVEISEIIRNFAANSGLKFYNKRSRQGFYRHLVLRKGKNTDEILVNLVTNKDDNVSSNIFYDLAQKLKDKVSSLFWTVNSSISDAVKADELTLLLGKKEIEEKLNIKGKTYSFNVSPFSFFQTNTKACEKLYETILDILKPQKNESVLDLYCGTGAIGIIFAPYVKKVLGVDEVESSIENAKINAVNNGISNADFMLSRIEKWIHTDEAAGFDAVILDPPRSGVSGKVIDFIGKRGFRKIVYVSCNPSTLARDLELLTGEHGYDVEEIVPVDMFPQTYHVESVTLLRKG